MYGGRLLEMFLIPLPQVLDVSPAVYYPALLILGVLALGFMRSCLIVVFQWCKFVLHTYHIYSYGIYIRVNNPTLNRIIGKYNLNHIWDRVLFNTPGLKLDSSQNQLHLHNNGQAQTNTANNQLLVATGHSGYALNSEHVLRES